MISPMKKPLNMCSYSSRSTLKTSHRQHINRSILILLYYSIFLGYATSTGVKNHPKYGLYILKLSLCTNTKLIEIFSQRYLALTIDIEYVWHFLDKIGCIFIIPTLFWKLE